MDTALILFVSDDEAMRDTVREVLELEGYDVVTVEREADALKYVEELAHRPDLIIDCIWNAGQPLEFSKTLRAQSPDVPLVFMLPHETGFDHWLDLRHWGANQLMLPPFTPRDLVAMVARQLRHRE